MLQNNKLDFSDFFSITPAVWKAKILEELKSNSEDILLSSSGNLVIKGFYTSEDVKPLSFMQDFHKHYIVKSPRYWYTLEKIDHQNLEESRTIILKALEKGADGFSFYINKPVSSEEIKQLLKVLPENFAMSLFYLGKDALEHVEIISSGLQETSKGSFIANVLTGKGLSAEEYLNYYKTSFNACRSFPKFRSLGINVPGVIGKTKPAEEIAASIGLAMDIIDHLSSSGISLKDILTNFSFSFSVGKNYLLEIAKLRAFRLVWEAVTQLTDSTFDSFATPLYVTTSEEYFVEDPYYNLLYNTTAAMSAIVGGCDALCITPFNSNTATADDFSRRISRNISFILRDEAHLDYVADPAGGAYMIESLTYQMAEEILKILNETESKGGWLKTMEKEGNL